MRTESGGVVLTIEGQPCSKANSRRLVTSSRTKKPLFIKSKAAQTYERDARRQMPVLDPLIEGPVSVTMTVYYASQRPDLDESLILDVLQGHVYRNDRQVREKHVYHAIDRDRPRAEITVEPLTAQQPALSLPEPQPEVAL